MFSVASKVMVVLLVFFGYPVCCLAGCSWGLYFFFVGVVGVVFARPWGVMFYDGLPLLFPGLIRGFCSFLIVYAAYVVFYLDALLSTFWALCLSRYSRMVYPSEVV